MRSCFVFIARAICIQSIHASLTLVSPSTSERRTRRPTSKGTTGARTHARINTLTHSPHSLARSLGGVFVYIAVEKKKPGAAAMAEKGIFVPSLFVTPTRLALLTRLLLCPPASRLTHPPLALLIATGYVLLLLLLLLMVVRISRWRGSSRAEGPRARFHQQRFSSSVSASTTRRPAGGRPPAAAQDRPAHPPDPFALLPVCVPGPSKHWARYLLPRQNQTLFLLPFIFSFAQPNSAVLRNAAVFGLSRELGLKGTQYNFALCIFFIPYILFEVRFCTPPLRTVRPPIQPFHMKRMTK